MKLNKYFWGTFRYHFLWGLNNWVLKYISPVRYRKKVHWYWYSQGFLPKGKCNLRWYKLLKLTCPEKPEGVVDDYTKLMAASYKHLQEKKEKERAEKVYDDSLWWVLEEHREFLRNYQVPHPDAE